MSLCGFSRPSPTFPASTITTFSKFRYFVPSRLRRRRKRDRFAAPAPAQTVSRPAAATIQVSQSAEGTEFYFPAARNKNFAATSTVFLLIFSAVAFFLAHHAPFIFPLAFGFFALLLLYISAQQWFGTSRVVMGSGGVTIQSGMLGAGTVQRIALSEIASISDRITAQQGGATGTPYYDIELRLRDGKKVTLGRSIRDKHETEWLVNQMQQLAGLQSKSMTASAN